MIKVTKIHGDEILINEDNIQWVECLPDTTITFLNGVKILIREKRDELLKLIEAQKKDPNWSR